MNKPPFSGVAQENNSKFHGIVDEGKTCKFIIRPTQDLSTFNTDMIIVPVEEKTDRKKCQISLSKKNLPVKGHCGRCFTVSVWGPLPSYLFVFLVN